jgi:hypothetical protein
VSQTWWHTPVFPVLGRLRQEDHHEFEANLGYIEKKIYLLDIRR